MVLKLVKANRVRLEAVTLFLDSGMVMPGQLNLATFLATHRSDEERAAVGCALGHYARAGASEVISLVPIHFLSQLKSPIMADALLEDHPIKDWVHWTLHYHTQGSEAFGMTAACLYLQMGQWDVHRLFYPAGSSYELRPPIESLVFRLNNMLRTL